MFLEILDWIFLVAALVVLVVQFQATSKSSYMAWNSAFWLLMAACFTINGIQSVSGWMWVWWAAAVACLIFAFWRPTVRPRSFEE